MKEVERTNMVVVKKPLQEQRGSGEGIRRDPYVINVDRRKNCYSYRDFGYLVWNCKNWGIVGQERRIEYRNNLNNTNNLEEKESLIALD